jgi:prepilin-type N-terminal cleavage/methylation domain-containing protein
MRHPESKNGRQGMSLLEVLVALAIFLFALIVLGRLVIMGGERARDVQELAQATQLCQSKLSEVAAGAVPLSSQSGVPLDEAPDWTWSLDCSQDDVANLWSVTIKVGKDRPDGSRIECTLSQKVLDPGQRGNALDGALAASANSSTATSTPASSPASGTSPMGGTTAPGGAATTPGGAATPGRMGTTPGTAAPGRMGTTPGGTQR